MEDTSAEHRTSREISNANLIPFKPGQSGNPTGRVAGQSITAKLRAILDKQYSKDGKTVADHIVDTIVKEILAGNIKYGFNTPLLKELLDRVEGKVTQPVATEGEITLRVKYDE